MIKITETDLFQQGMIMGAATRPISIGEGGVQPEPGTKHLYDGIVEVDAAAKEIIDFKDYVTKAGYMDSMYLLKQEDFTSSFTTTINARTKHTYLIVLHRGSMSINSEFSLVAISPYIYVTESNQAISIYRTDNIGEVQVNITHPSGQRLGIVCFNSDDEYIPDEQDPTGSNNYSSSGYTTENGCRYLLASSAVYASGSMVFTHSIKNGSILKSVGTSERLLVTTFDSTASQDSNITSTQSTGTNTINYIYLRKKV